MSDVYAPELWPQRRPRMYTPERDAFLRDNPDVPVAILAYQMRLSDTFIKCYQRKLGIRPLTGNKPRKK
jgi:hypothetical protein